jgi:hypothetical protein
MCEQSRVSRLQHPLLTGTEIKCAPLYGWARPCPAPATQHHPQTQLQLKYVSNKNQESSRPATFDNHHYSLHPHSLHRTSLHRPSLHPNSLHPHFIHHRSIAPSSFDSLFVAQYSSRLCIYIVSCVRLTYTHAYKTLTYEVQRHRDSAYRHP